MASLKVFDPVQVPASILQELQQTRASLAQARQEIELLRLDNGRLPSELDQARHQLEQARRQAKRQSAPFSKGPPASKGQTPRTQARCRPRQG